MNERHILKLISLKNKSMTSNHISLNQIVIRSKPELPVVSACSTLSLPWRFLEGFQAGCTLDSRSPGQALLCTHSRYPRYRTVHFNMKTTAPQAKRKSVVPCNYKNNPICLSANHRDFIYLCVDLQFNCAPIKLVEP